LIRATLIGRRAEVPRITELIAIALADAIGLRRTALAADQNLRGVESVTTVQVDKPGLDTGIRLKRRRRFVSRVLKRV
jgi:hypothetical protein